MENGWAGIILPAVLDVGKSMLGGPLNQHILSMGGGGGGKREQSLHKNYHDTEPEKAQHYRISP